MLGRRQGEVAPTRKVALKIEMRPTGRPRKTDALASSPGRRAASAPPDFEPVMVDRMPRVRSLARSRAFDRFGGLVSAREGWPKSEFPRRIKRSTIRFALQGL